MQNFPISQRTGICTQNHRGAVPEVIWKMKMRAMDYLVSEQEMCIKLMQLGPEVFGENYAKERYDLADKAKMACETCKMACPALEQAAH